MAHNKNHHYVPQYFFRFFVEEHNIKKPKIVNMLLVKNGLLKENVSIADQASKNNFYINADNEKSFSNIEGEHKNILSTLNKIDSIQKYNNEKNTIDKIFEVVLFQYFRTLDKYMHIKSISESFIDTIKKQIIEESNEFDELLETGNLTKENLINNTSVKLNEKYFNELLTVLTASSFIYKEVIADLGVYILNNATNEDFIFSDNPVIFYNLAFNEIKTNSMVALQSPGLMIFFPISRKKCILLLDEKKYFGNLINSYYFDITKESDINIINKLQIHNATNAIYFSKYSNKKNIQKLYRQEKNNLKIKRVDFKLVQNELTFIPEKIDFKINLTFFKSKKLFNYSNIQYRNKILYDLIKIKENSSDNFKEKIHS